MWREPKLVPACLQGLLETVPGCTGFQMGTETLRMSAYRRQEGAQGAVQCIRLQVARGGCSMLCCKKPGRAVGGKGTGLI